MANRSCLAPTPSPTIIYEETATNDRASHLPLLTRGMSHGLGPRPEVRVTVELAVPLPESHRSGSRMACVFPARCGGKDLRLASTVSAPEEWASAIQCPGNFIE